ncbi:ABC transporter permease [Actinocrispum wychmicini]|uniref:Transport permease protein n=1 Tax=Actinocrispum wychmicini TaxID=1213861 RepID=A0A4V2S546_9PSEU|nr:ABC transporter permease [Actinocrispum wychmicini]TCO50770.1 lipooligosaccharide transport system permease protein [Actinocrispum wychmicini]
MTTVSRSTGQVPTWRRAVLLYIEAAWTWYRRNWRSTLVSSVLTPLFFLVAMGFGLGSRIQPSAATDGLPYAVYLAPAMLASAAVQNAAGESTFPVLSGFRWSRVFWGIASTPVTAAQIAAGQLLWIAARITFSGLAFVLVAALLGAVESPLILLSLVFSLLAGMAFAAPLVAYSATIDSEGQQFNAVFRFIVLPMTLIAGTFFPLTALPVWVQPLAWITPLWHGTELSRGVAFGTLDLWPALGHVAYLLALTLVGTALAARYFRRRLEK